MSHIPPKKENLGGREEKGKRIAWKNQTIYILYFLTPVENRGTAASVSWGSPQPRAEQPQIPVSCCLCWGSRGFVLPTAELSPSWGWEAPSSWRHLLEPVGNQPCHKQPAPAAQLGFYLPLTFWAKVCFAGKFLTSLSWYICVLRKFATLKKEYDLSEGREKKNPSMQTVTWLCQSSEPHSSSAGTGHGDSTRVQWTGLYRDAGKNNLRWLAHSSARNGNIWTHNTLKDD